MKHGIRWVAHGGLWACCAWLCICADPAQAASAWSNAYITVSVNEEASAIYQLGSIGDYIQWDGLDLGVVYSLTLEEISIDYWNDPADRTYGQLFYELMVEGTTEPWTEGDLYWTQQDLSGGNYRGTWSGQIDLLDGAASEGASAELRFWAISDGASGLDYFDNEGQNYVGSMMAIPEPLTMGLFGLGAAALLMFRSRKT